MKRSFERLPSGKFHKRNALAFFWPLPTIAPISDVTQFLSAIDAGDFNAAERLLPLVYEELRRLAASRMAHEKPGQTLQATALVHEAWLRLHFRAGTRMN